jgi:hypothetical protein
MVSAPVRGQHTIYVCQRGRSVRRACAPLSVAQSRLNYESRMEKKDAPAVTRMLELAAQYQRYGYRRIQMFLERRGHAMRPAGNTGYGDCMDRKCRENGPVIAWRGIAHARCWQGTWATCGPTTMCSMSVPIAGSSSAGRRSMSARD